MAFGTCCIPHPEKVHRGGEDAYFISEDGTAFGAPCAAVAPALQRAWQQGCSRLLTQALLTGVGSWILSGIDAGEYAKQLMLHACEAAKGTAPGKGAPLEMLTAAQARTHLQVLAPTPQACTEQHTFAPPSQREHQLHLPSASSTAPKRIIAGSLPKQPGPCAGLLDGPGHDAGRPLLARGKRGRLQLHACARRAGHLQVPLPAAQASGAAQLPWSAIRLVPPAEPLLPLRFNFPYQLAAGSMGDPPSCAEVRGGFLGCCGAVAAAPPSLADPRRPAAVLQHQPPARRHRRRRLGRPVGQRLPRGGLLHSRPVQVAWQAAPGRGRRPRGVRAAAVRPCCCYWRAALALLPLRLVASPCTCACRAESEEDSPFSVGARQAGMWGMAGGKLDDITVVVACVEPPAKL